MPGSIRIFVFRFSTFPSFIFSVPTLADPETNLTTDFTDPIWIKDRRPLPQIHPDPILSPSVVKNACVDPGLSFPISTFLDFIFSAPLRVTSRPSRCLLSRLRTCPRRRPFTPRLAVFGNHDRHLGIPTLPRSIAHHRPPAPRAFTRWSARRGEHGTGHLRRRLSLSSRWSLPPRMELHPRSSPGS